MRITMKQAVALYNIYPIIKKASFPLIIAYRFSKGFDVISKEMEFYREHFNKILERYGEKDDQGQFVTQDDFIKIKLGCESSFQQELNELDNIQFDLDNFNFKLSDLEGINLTLEQMNSLLPFITE